nr:MAG TPA: dystroglycan [Caudoviricetes sp.]
MHNDIWWLTFLVMAGIFIIILGLGIIALIF